MDNDTAYNDWVLDPSPENTGKWLKTVTPLINSEIQRYTGPKPLLRSKGKGLAINALRTYDPTRGTKLTSWVVTQMQPLSRYSQRLKPVRSSELAVRQAAEVDTQRKQFEIEYDKEPTDAELADIVGISQRRIKLLRDKVNAVIPEAALVDAETGGIDLPTATESNTLDFATEATYHGLTPREKLIFDWKTGGHGKPTLENQEIARRLGISPAAISQTTAAIAGQIQRANENVI